MRAEQLEPRAMLALSAVYYDDARVLNGVWDNTEKGVLELTIDGSDNKVDCYMRYEAATARYLFADNSTFTNPIIVSSGFPASAGPGIPNVSSWYRSLGPVARAGTDLTHGYELLTSVAAGSQWIPHTSILDTISVKTANITPGEDAPTFTFVGASSTLTRTLLVDLGQGIPGSSITIDAPVNVAAATADGALVGPTGTPGSIALTAESIKVNAAIASRNDVSLVSVLGTPAAATPPAGIVIKGSITGSGAVDIEVDSTAFHLAAGARIGGAPSLSSIYLRTRDADAVIEGTISADDHFYDIGESALAGGPQRSLSTVSPGTGANTGKLIGKNGYIYLADRAGGTVALQTSLDGLRITSAADTPANALDYDISITNDKSLLLDAISASQGDISLAATTGTITLSAAIDTPGSFSLSSGADLQVNSAITSAKNISLTSTTGSVTTNAAIKTSESATSFGKVTIVANTDVTVNSLIQAEYDGVSITATKGRIADANASGGTSSNVLPTGPEVDRGTLIDDDVDVNTPGFFSAKIQAGGAATMSGGGGITAQGVFSKLVNLNCIYEFINYIDVGSNGGAFSLGSTTITKAPTLVAPDVVVSEGTFLGDNNQLIRWSVQSTYKNGVAKLFNTLSLSSDQPLGNIRFINYLDEDIQSVSDDFLYVAGTPGKDDFRLYTIDGVERVGFSQGGSLEAGAGLVGASYLGFAADRFSALRSAITGSGTSYSLQGNINTKNLPAYTDPVLGKVYGQADVTTAYAWQINPSATSSKISTFLELVPEDISKKQDRLTNASSRVTGTSATLMAATGITLGTNVSSATAVLTDSGDIVIEDNGTNG
ncbi:MAG: hypothetical protein ACKOEM_02675, partial [Planctomycetia bacterium]